MRRVITKADAAKTLGVTLRTIQRYVKHFLERGEEALRDKRRGHHRKITEEDERRIVACKEEKTHCSARFIRDHLKLSVSEEAVRLVLVKHGFNRISLPPVKPIKRFVAEGPNELWQVDIMGKVRFPLVGDLYLILALDDHSRFILSGAFFLGSLNSMCFWFFIGRLLSGEFLKGFFQIGEVNLRLPIAMGRLIISGMPRI